VCTSGDADDLVLTDAIAEKVMVECQTEYEKQNSTYGKLAIEQIRDNKLWIQQAFNDAVASGQLKGPVMLSRDHHDVSGTDAPWRETSNIKDGSQFTADMAIQNVIGDSFRGATSVSIHNGGGTGWGEAINGGFLLCLDGSVDSARRARSMLHWDVFNGVSRRSWAGNNNAIAYVEAEKLDNPSFEVYSPTNASDELLEGVISS